MDEFFENFLEALKNPWVIFGFGAQALFFMRFLVQWIASEREGRSVVPVAFWWFSIGGACGLLVYAVQKADPVFIFGQSLGLFIYTRNLMLIRREKLTATAAVASQDPASMSPATRGEEHPPAPADAG